MDNNCPLNHLVIIRYFEKRNDFLKIFVFNQVFEIKSFPVLSMHSNYYFHNGCIGQGKLHFVVRDSLCFTEGIQGMSRRNFCICNWSSYIKQKRGNK